MCGSVCVLLVIFFFFKQKTAYEMRISDWSSDVLLFRSAPAPNLTHPCSPDLPPSEWSKIDDILDYEGDKECRARSIARKRLSASCVKQRSCLRRGRRRRKRVGGSRSASKPTIGGAKNMAA